MRRLPLALLLLAAGAAGQTTRVELVERIAPEAALELYDAFGSAVDVANEVAVVGASGDAGPGGLDRSGAVYVFRWDGQTWVKTHRIEGTHPEEGRRFGSAVALEYGRLVVGAPGATDADGARTGAVYVFEFSGLGYEGGEWEQTARVQARLRDNGDLGSAVALSGNTILAGAPSRNVTGGAVLVLEAGSAGWAVVDTLAGASTPGGLFGRVLGLDGGRAVVYEGGSSSPVASRVLRFYARGPGRWAETGRDSLFFRGANSLALDGDRLAVGQGRSAEAQDARVLVYEHEGAGWVRADSLAPERGGEGFRDVESVSLAGDLVVAYTRRAGPDGRALTAFDRGLEGWSPRPLAFDRNLWRQPSVATDGTWLVQGDSDGGDTPGARDTGAATISAIAPEASGEARRLVVPGVRRSGAQFGRSVAFSGDGVIAGGQGAAYVMRKASLYGLPYASGEAWRAAQVLGSPGEGPPARAVVDGDWMLVGNAAEDRVRTYRREGETWTPGPALAGTGRFGDAVALDGARAVVGAPLDGAGAAHVYERDAAGWRRVATLRGTGVAVRFGHAVAISGGRALVASREARADGTRGTVRLYERLPDGAWDQTATLAPPEAEGVFGSALAMQGGRLLAATQITQGPPDLAETVSVFGGTAPAFQATLRGPTPRAQFGIFAPGLSLDGDRVLVGAPSSDVQGRNAGAAYLFEFDGAAWSEGIEILPPAGSRGQFGAAVAVDGRRLLVGAPLDDGDATDAGAAFLYAVTSAVPSDRQRPLAEAALGAPWPNPARDRATVTFTAPAPVHLTLTVHDALGREVAAPVRREVRGATTVTLGTGALAPGVYLVRAAWPGGAQTRPLTVVR